MARHNGIPTGHRHCARKRSLPNRLPFLFRQILQVLSRRLILRDHANEVGGTVGSVYMFVIY